MSDLWCRTAEKCGKAKTCAKCRERGCGWCVARGVCVLDEQQACDGAKDHIGLAGPLGQLECG